MISNRHGAADETSAEVPRSANGSLPGREKLLNAEVNGIPGGSGNRSMFNSESNSKAEYEAPKDEMEAKLAAIWAEVLMLERVGRRDDFFELGGDSIAAVQLMMRLQEVIPEQTLPLRAILEAPTVEQFAAWLHKERASDSEQQVLVQIRPGSSQRPPFFCLHASDGTAIGMKPLAEAFDDDLPFYCLQAKGLDGSEPFASIEEAARYCLNQIRTIQPNGPYYLGGYCFGGFVALEMARALEQIGESVPVLVMIDSFNPAHLRGKTTLKMLFTLVRFYLRRGAIHAGRMRRLGPGAWFRYAEGRLRAIVVHARRFRTRLAQVKSKQHASAPDFTAPAASLDQILKRLERVGPALASKWTPGTYSGGAMIFRVSERSHDPYEDYFLGWRPLIRGPLESFEIEAEHDTILIEPAVRQLAAKIDSRLRKTMTAAKEEPVH